MSTAGLSPGTPENPDCSGDAVQREHNKHQVRQGFQLDRRWSIRTQWESTGIYVWFFLAMPFRQTSLWISQTHQHGHPQPCLLLAAAAMSTKHFMNHPDVFDTKFCGDWAGATPLGRICQKSTEPYMSRVCGSKSLSFNEATGYQLSQGLFHCAAKRDAVVPTPFVA